MYINVVQVMECQYYSNDYDFKYPLWVKYYERYVILKYDELVQAFENFSNDPCYDPEIYNKCSTYTLNGNFYHNLLSNNINHNVTFLNYMFNQGIYPDFNLVNYENENVVQCCKINKNMLRFLLVGHKSLIKFQQHFRKYLHKKKLDLCLIIIKCSPEFQIEYNHYSNFNGGIDYLNCKNNYTLGLCNI